MVLWSESAASPAASKRPMSFLTLADCLSFPWNFAWICLDLIPAFALDLAHEVPAVLIPPEMTPGQMKGWLNLQGMKTELQWTFSEDTAQTLSSSPHPERPEHLSSWSSTWLLDPGLLPLHEKSQNTLLNDRAETPVPFTPLAWWM